LFVGSDKEQSLQKKRGYTWRISRCHSECCCPHKETWKSTQTNNTRSSHTGCKVRWIWRWDFKKFVLYYKKISHFSATNFSFKH